MHLHRAFAWTDEEEMLAFLNERSFATLFVPLADGPVLAYAPILAKGRKVRLHLSNRHPASASVDGTKALLSCLGADAYVSPDWYGSDDQVPTWNYLAAQCEGRLRRLDEDETIRLLDDLSDVHERALLPKPVWTRHKMTPGRFEAMLRAIVGFELDVERLSGTRKLGQNKRADEREGAAAALDQIGRADMAALMRTPS